MIYKRLSYGMTVVYLVVVVRLLTEQPNQEWSDAFLIGALMFAMGAVPICVFFYSKRDALEQFFNQPNAKLFFFALLGRAKKRRDYAQSDSK